jgi:hypothetical protein
MNNETRQLLERYKSSIDNSQSDINLYGDIEAALEKPVQSAISLDMKVLAITTAYEQGFGKGEQGIMCGCPYTVGDWTGCDIAWNFGYAEGKSKIAKPVPEPIKEADPQGNLVKWCKENEVMV